MEEQPVGPISPIGPIDRPLEHALETVRVRWALVRGVEAVLLLLAIVLAGALVLFAADNLLHLGTAVRVGAGVALLALLVVVWGRFLLRLVLLRPSRREQLLLMIERVFPSLDNRLINVERLSRDGRTPPGILALLRADALRLVGGMDLRAVLPWGALKTLAVATAVVVVLFAAYACLLPNYFSNALYRYTLPGRSTPPITRTMLKITPGNATLVEGAALPLRAEVHGAIPAGAQVQTAGGCYEMHFTGELFEFEFRDVAAPFDYRVVAGDAESETFHVTVQHPARIEKLAVRYTYPKYLNLEPRTEDPANGNLSAVEGSVAELTVKSTKPLEKLNLLVKDLPPPRQEDGRWVFDVVKCGSYHFAWRDREGLAGLSPVYVVTAVKDLPPTVRLVEPARDLSITTDGTFTALVQANDDFALAAVQLRAVKNEREQMTLADFPIVPDAQAGPANRNVRDLRASKLIHISELGLKAGEGVGLYAMARDRKGSETTSNVVYVRVIDEEQAREALIKELAGIAERLRQAVVWQTKVREAAQAPQPVLETIVPDQYTLLKMLLSIHGAWTNPELRHLAARARLEALITGPATQAVEQVKTDLPTGIKTQGVIITELEGIIAELEGMLAKLKTGDVEKTLAAAAEKTPKQGVKDLLAGLKDFAEQQKKIIEDTKAMKLAAGEDYSDDAKKKLDTLKQTEEQWGKFLQDKATDLSKLPPQDFSNGSLSKELNSAFSEVKLAAEALNQKAVEMAIPLEESGLELAKQISANIERWLADAPDNQKWNMEEPVKDVEVPMADLPAELEDLVGDLLDKEDKLAEESQDVTSSWMDSMDQGAGWAAADGPIANMSAKGITGNLQPNDQEIGGRSGEGRSGKSSGQMVGDTATGKGGKQTPSRSTPDAFEPGQVKDSSKDPTGGSTGGGKLSGANKEGLRGLPPAETWRKMERLADQQADIRNITEKAQVGMRQRGYVSQDLAAAAERMHAVEDQLRRKQAANYRAEFKSIVEKLDSAKKTVQDQLELTRDPARPAPRQKRLDINNAMDEQIPAEFQDWVKEYYKALAQ